jgi:Mg2+ and Co2+ transporter CorA
MIQYYYEEMAKTKEAIIRQKMDTLFEYVSESKSAAEFKKLVVDYRSMNELFQEHLAEHNDAYFSETRKELARLKQMKLYELERSMEELLETYKTTHSPHVLKELVDAIAKEYVPETEQLRKIRYNTMEIEEPIDTGIVKLVQSPLDFSKMDYLMGEAPRVLQSVSKRD